MVVAGLGELGEEIDTARVGALIVGKAEALDFFDLTGALVGAAHSEGGDGMYTLVQADALGEENDGVFPEETVEDGDLTDLGSVSIMLDQEAWGITYWCDIVEEFAQERDNVVYILVAFNETKTLAPCQLANDIESEELQPLAKVAAATRVRVDLLGSIQPVS